MAALAPASSFVTAVVVTNGANAFLPFTLAALARQARPADRVIVLDASGHAATWDDLGIAPTFTGPLPARPKPLSRPTWDEDDAAAGTAYAGALRSPLAPAAGSRAALAAPAVLAADDADADADADGGAGGGGGVGEVGAAGGEAGAAGEEVGVAGEAREAGAPARESHELPLERWELRAVTAANLAQALESLEGEELGEWLWVLHADSAPAPTCLAELLRSALAATTVGMVGPKQIGWTQPQFLLSVGVQATSSGRRRLDVEPGDIDQGQLDGRTDVLAVGTAGALLRVEAWRAVHGLDRRIGKFGEGLEYGRRLWRARWRVIVAPEAVVHHARQSLRCVEAPYDRPLPQGSHSGRRAAQLHYSLSGRSLLWLLPSLLLLLPAAVARACWRLVAKQPRAAAGELWAGLLTLWRAPWIVATRLRTSRVASAGAAVLRPLHSSTPQWAASHVSRWRHQRLLKERRVAPSELEIAQQRSLTVRRRLALGFALAAAGAASAWLAQRVGLNPAGGAYASLTGTLADQLALARADLATGGTAMQAGLPPLALVVALLAAPLTPFLPLEQAVGALHLGLPVASALTAWAAAGIGVRRVRVRLALALVWATSPVLLGAVAQGRTAAALAHAALPAAIFFLARAIGVNRLDRVARWRSGQARQSALHYTNLHPRVVGLTAAAGAGLSLAVLWAAAPAYLLLAPALLWWLRRRPGFIPLVVAPGAVLLGPWLVALAGRGWQALPALLWPAGPLVALQSPSTWLSALLPSVSAHPLAALPTLVVCALAAWTFMVSPVARPAVRWGAAGAAAGLLLAWAAPHVLIGQAAAPGGSVGVYATSHAGASLLLAGALVIVAAGRPGAPRAARSPRLPAAAEPALTTESGATEPAPTTGAAAARARLLAAQQRSRFSHGMRPSASRWQSAASVALTLACAASLAMWTHGARAAAASGGCYAPHGWPQQPGWAAAVSRAVYGSPQEQAVTADSCLHPSPELPVAVASAQGAPHRARLLFVSPGRYPQVALREAAGTLLTDAQPHLHPAGAPAEAGRDEVVAAFAGALYGRDSLSQAFSDHGVDGVVAPIAAAPTAAAPQASAAPGEAGPPSPWDTSAKLTAALDVAPGLRHAARSAGAIFWRVGEATAEQGAPVGQVSRLRFLPDSGAGLAYQRLPMGRTAATAVVGEAGTIALAETAPGWRIHADGEALPTRAEGGLLLADVPAGVHTVHVDYAAAGAEPWWWLRVGVLALSALLVLPLRRPRLIGEDE
ncbi:glycosyltransferase [Buchananella felis]|uniref:glycosyltransferase n=1 Tax=Buchananella felis TaxID=3231492 RepID=UPI00352887B2